MTGCQNLPWIIWTSATLTRLSFTLIVSITRPLHHLLCNWSVSQIITKSPIFIGGTFSNHLDRLDDIGKYSDIHHISKHISFSFNGSGLCVELTSSFEKGAHPSNTLARVWVVYYLLDWLLAITNFSGCLPSVLCLSKSNIMNVSTLYQTLTYTTSTWIMWTIKISYSSP